MEWEEVVPYSNTYTCASCEVPYLAKGSTSDLPLTFCSVLCEISSIGCGIEQLEAVKGWRKSDI